MTLYLLCLSLFFFQQSQCLPGYMNLYLILCKTRRMMGMCAQYDKLQYLGIRRKQNSSWDIIICYHSKISIKPALLLKPYRKIWWGCFPIKEWQVWLSWQFMAHSGVLLALLPICPFCDVFLSCFNTLGPLSDFNSCCHWTPLFPSCRNTRSKGWSVPARLAAQAIF